MSAGATVIATPPPSKRSDLPHTRGCTAAHAAMTLRRAGMLREAAPESLLRVGRVVLRSHFLSSAAEATLTFRHQKKEVRRPSQCLP